MAEHRAQLKKVADALNANTKPLSELSKAMQAGDDSIGLRPARQSVADSLEAVISTLLTAQVPAA